VFLIALSWLIGSLTAACAQHPIRDSSRPAFPSSFAQSIYWIDNKRVLFFGLDGRHVKRSDGSDWALSSLYLWDVESGAVESLGDIATSLCYANGYVRYPRWKLTNGEPGKDFEVLAGEFGKEALIDTSGSAPIDPETCKPRTTAPLPEWTQGKAVKRLRPEHGFLVLGPEKDDRNWPVTYHPNGNPQGIPMPFKRREAYLAFINYVPFKGAYFLTGDYFIANPEHPLDGYNRSPWPKGLPIPMWWLYPDGRVEEIRLPTDSRFATATTTFPAKAGVYYISPDYPHGDGLFKVIDQNKVERIIKGFIDAYAVSPDGCRIAMDHDPSYVGKRGLGTLKVIDICARGN
jgi:hypothetical protein